MKNIKFLLMVVLLIMGSVYAGGGNRNGTAGASELLIPVGTRGIALGSSTVANSSGIESIFWNPANLDRSERNVGVLFSHMSYIADIGVQYGAVSSRIGNLGTIALSIKSLDIGDISRTTRENPDGTGSTYSPQYMTVGISYSKMLNDRIAVGLTANYISETIDLVEATGIAFNVGISYMNLANVDGLSLGIVIKNLGPDMQFEGSGLYVQAAPVDFERPSQTYLLQTAGFALPATLEIGMSYKQTLGEAGSLAFSGAFENNNFYDDDYRFGAEYSFNDMFFIRGGYSVAPQLESDDRTFGLTAGAGFVYNMGGVDLKFDYAYRDVEYFDANHIISLELGL